MDFAPHRSILHRLSRTDPAPVCGTARMACCSWPVACRSRKRPPKLDAAARALLATASSQSPFAYDYPVTTWTMADLTDLLGRHGWYVHPVTFYRALQAMGYRYRRPRHDLTHHQDSADVAAAKHVLADLQKRGLVPELDSGLSTWMNATSIPTPTWQKSWQRRGRPVRVPAAGQDQRLAVCGALDDASGQVVWSIAERKGGTGLPPS